MRGSPQADGAGERSLAGVWRRGVRREGGATRRAQADGQGAKWRRRRGWGWVVALADVGRQVALRWTLCLAGWLEMFAGDIGAGRRARRGGARGGRFGELAGLPEFHHLFETAEQAGEGCQDEGVQCRHEPGLGGLVVGHRAHAGSDAGDVLGQGWWRSF